MAQDSGAFISAISALLQRPQSTIGKAARQRVLADYTWERNLERVDELLSPEAARRFPATDSQSITITTAGVSA